MNNLFYEVRNNQIGFFKCDILTNVPHLHNELELIISLDGEAKAHADDKVYDIKKGELFLAFPNQVHFYNYISGTFMVCIFSSSIIYKLSGILSKNYPENNKAVVHDKKLLSAIDLLCNCEGEHQETIICGCLNILIPSIVSQFNLTDKKPNNISIIKDFINFCADNYHEQLSLDYVADQLHISKYYLSHLLNKTLKISFADYIKSLRINEACILLEKEDNKIADISENVGYGTIRSFNRAFKDIMNVSPSQYKEMLNKFSSNN